MKRGKAYVHVVARDQTGAPLTPTEASSAGQHGWSFKNCEVRAPTELGERAGATVRIPSEWFTSGGDPLIEDRVTLDWRPFPQESDEAEDEEVSAVLENKR